MLSRPPHLEASTLVTEYSHPMSFAYPRLRHNLESTNLVTFSAGALVTDVPLVAHLIDKIERDVAA